VEPDYIDVVYHEHPLTYSQPSGFTQRLSIDTSETYYAGRSVYVSSTGPREPSDALLIAFGSAALSAETRPGVVTDVWGFYAKIPEPNALVLIVIAASLTGGKAMRLVG